MPVDLTWPITAPAPVTNPRFSLQAVSVVNASTVRIKFTYQPKATDSSEPNDGLNIANWSIVGPALNYVTSVTPVTGSPQSLDLHLAAALVPGHWTVTAINIVSAIFVALTAPTALSFDYALVNSFPSLNDGAVNDSNCDILRRFLNPAIRGSNIDAIMSGICYGDSVRNQIATSAFDQLFITSASGIYLDRRTADIGIKRPSAVGMSDVDLRNLAIVIDNQKLTREAILETLEVYYGKETVKASTTSVDEPFALVDEDELNIVCNYDENITILFESNAFVNIGQATALEVETFINNKLIDLGSTARASTTLNTTTGNNQVTLFSGKRGLGSSIKIVGGRAQNVLGFPEALFTDLGGSPYQSWDITLDAVNVGNLVFTTTNSTKYDFNQLLEGDIVYIYGTEFAASGNVGAFPISNIQIYYTGSNLIQSFEITNPFGSASIALSQLSFQSLRFFRPIDNTLYTQLRRVIVTKLNKSLDIIIPATTQIVSRTPQTGSYSKLSDVLSLSSLIRASGVATAVSATAHGLSLGDFITIDGAMAQIGLPSIVAGTASGAFSSNLATGTTNASIVTTVSASNTIEKIRHKAVSLPNNILMVVGGQTQHDSGTPIVANKTPCVLDITSKTTVSGGLQEAYRWKQLVHTITAGNYAFGTSVLKDGRVLVTGGFNSNNQISTTAVPVNNYDVLSYNPTISQDSQVSGTLPLTLGGHSQCSLLNNNAIICGGWDTQLNWNLPLTSTYKFTGASNIWSSVGALTYARMDHETVVLSNGNVLAIGGRAPFRRIGNTEDPDTIAYYALDTAPANVTPDLINANNISLSAGVDAVSNKGKAGLSFLPGASTNSHTTAGAAQTALNTALLGEWAVECWVLAGATGTFISNGTAGGGTANNCLLSFGVSSQTPPNNNDGLFYWRWESGSHVENIQYSTVLAGTLMPTYEGADQGIWHQVSLTKTKAISGTAGLYDVKLYVDGTLIQTWVDQTNAAGGSTGLLYLAKDPTSTTLNQLSTRIDEVRIIAAARGDSAIRTHYNEQCGYTLFDSMDYWTSNYKIGKCLNSCELYNVTGELWNTTGNLTYARTAFGAVKLPDDRVMVFGGLGNGRMTRQLLPITLINPGAESGTGFDGNPTVTPVIIPGWTTVSGNPSVMLWANTHSFPTSSDLGPPSSRGNNYFYGGPNNALSVIKQTLSFAGYETSIDSSLISFSLSAYLGGAVGRDDNAKIDLVWKSSVGATISTSTIGPVLAADRANVKGMIAKATAGNVPAGTRTVDVTVTFTRVSTTDNDSFVDNIKLAFFSGTQNAPPFELFEQNHLAKPLNSCEIYDNISGRWTVGPQMPNAREFPTCVLLNNQIWVMGGRDVAGIDILDLATMTWKTSISTVPAAPYRSVGGLVDSQTLAMCGGAISTAATSLYVSPHNADITSRLGTIIIPATEQVIGGRFDGTFQVSNIVNGTTFQYNTLDTSYATAITTGVTATKVAAKASSAGLQGPYTYDTKTGLSITSVSTTLTTNSLQQGQNYSIINVASTVGIPNEPGYVAFNFGYSNQVGPVRYSEVLSTTKLLIDPTFTILHTLPIGSTVTLLAGRVPFQPEVQQQPGNFYITPSSAGRIAAQATLNDIVAAGIDVNVDVVYPSGRGLGSAGYPVKDSYKLSDIFTVFGGDDLDNEEATARKG